MMGYLLCRMIRDGAPAEWTPLMRLVASVIADDAHDPDPRKPPPKGEWPWSAMPLEGYKRADGKWRDGLTERTGMSAQAVTRVLARLAAVNYEMRIQIANRDGDPVTDSLGRPLFAAKGHALRFRVPPLTARPELQSSPDLATYSAHRSPELASYSDLWSSDSATFEAQRSSDSATFEPQRSSFLTPKVIKNDDPVSSISPQKKNAGVRTPRRPRKERPSWCGRCDKTTRQLEDPETGLPKRCPDCHPDPERRWS